ncbi:hypothetical protein [Streptomyces specialis]|uniref:hypothetical protein n=1 Tax=Streptomyces specialis TaxID=498367 RepID=UPI00073E1FED|nr:hypothetical protein [Streptomyces specialis]
MYTGHPHLAQRAARHTEALLQPGHRYDTADPGFLTGMTGAALALAEHRRLLPTPHTTTWDALLLLS